MPKALFVVSIKSIVVVISSSNFIVLIIRTRLLGATALPPMVNHKAALDDKYEAQFHCGSLSVKGSSKLRCGNEDSMIRIKARLNFTYDRLKVFRNTQLVVGEWMAAVILAIYLPSSNQSVTGSALLNWTDQLWSYQ